MNEDERYLFDLNGYIVIEGLITADQVARCNEYIEHQLAADVAQFKEGGDLTGNSQALAGTSRRLGLSSDVLAWERPYCEPFRDLIAHPRLAPYLETILEEGFRVDAGPSIMATDSGAEGHALHGGGVERHNFSEAYFFKNNRIYSGMIVVEIPFADEGPDDGGLALVPGSHKANLPAPASLRRAELYTEHIRKIPLKAGDAVIFTETTTHGALPWRAAHQRRLMMTRYSPGFIAFHGLKQSLTEPDYFADLTDAQKAVLASPHYRVA
jgi:ectoine hydroxylase-related dioxygenase (phytanoyl-CoA dioxygenase family)